MMDRLERAREEFSKDLYATKLSGAVIEEVGEDYTQTHVHRVSDAIQPPHPLSSPSPPAPSPSQHQSLFQ